MTVTTDEYWDADGQNLNNLAFNIETLGGRWRGNKVRGSNIKVPNRAGGIWVPKVVDEKELNLAMWVRGADEDGLIPTGDNAKLAQFNDNWRQLLQIFNQPNRLIALTRRWYDNVASPVLKSATAMAEVTNVMDPSMLGRQLARFVVTLNLPDPYFYGAEQTTTLPVGVAQVINNPGDDIARVMTVEMEGTLVNPKVTNATPTPDVWVKYGGTIPSDDILYLDTQEFTAFDDDGENKIGGVTHSGSRQWMNLLPGNNSLTLTADSGTGNTVIRFRPPYF